MLHFSSLTSAQSAIKNKKAIIMRNVSALSTPERKEGQTEFKYIGPEPKRFSVAKGQVCKVLAASTAILLRRGSGGLVHGYSASFVPKVDGSYTALTVRGKQLQETGAIAGLPRPAQLLELYDFEACPCCRKVREAISTLDLDVAVFPCPKGGATWRAKMKSLGGKLQFPFLVDHNTGRQMYESDEIVRYLFETYGDGRVPPALAPGMLLTATCVASQLPRALRGLHARPSKGDPAALQPVTIWGYELSPFSKLVREVLCELEIPYVQISAARGSSKRIGFFEKHGKFQVPYIEDPNQGVSLFESAAIVKYLVDTYGADGASSPSAKKSS